MGRLRRAGSRYTLSVVGTLTNPNYNITQRNSGIRTVTAAGLSADQLASTIVRDEFDPTASPDDAKPLFGGEAITPALGTGVFYADPRFDNIFVCFGGGVCFAFGG